MRGLGIAIRFAVWIEAILRVRAFIGLRVRANVLRVCQIAAGPLEIMMVCTALMVPSVVLALLTGKGNIQPAGFSSLQIGSHVHRTKCNMGSVDGGGYGSRLKARA
ncbi:hypothetical protein FKP32DRAFT_1591685 [Trametes sanguinea]|nr:hypothetical protein FKP32DRAFT_1591685 [Trametes sanguinea]